MYLLLKLQEVVPEKQEPEIEAPKNIEPLKKEYTVTFRLEINYKIYQYKYIVESENNNEAKIKAKEKFDSKNISYSNFTIVSCKKKKINDKESSEFIKELIDVAMLQSKLDDIEKRNFNLIHSILGAEIAKNEYGLDDDIVNAIKYHTTGRENMSMLEKIIYLADATEPNRNYMSNENELSLNELVELIKTNIDEGLEYTLKWNLQSVLRRNLLVHLNTVKAYNFYHLQNS